MREDGSIKDGVAFSGAGSTANSSRACFRSTVSKPSSKRAYAAARTVRASPAPIALPKQLCEAGRGAKFPGSRLLSPRPIKRLHELLLGFTRCIGVPGPKQDFSIDPKKLGKIPVLLVAKRSLQCLIDCSACLIPPAYPAQCVGIFSEEQSIIDSELDCPELIQCRPEQRHPFHVAPAPNGEHPTKATTKGLPEVQRLALGILEQHGHVSVEGLEVTGEESHRTCALDQGLA